jgi:hypothetical protein
VFIITRSRDTPRKPFFFTHTAWNTRRMVAMSLFRPSILITHTHTHTHTHTCPALKFSIACHAHALVHVRWPRPTKECTLVPSTAPRAHCTCSLGGLGSAVDGRPRAPVTIAGHECVEHLLRCEECVGPKRKSLRSCRCNASKRFDHVNMLVAPARCHALALGLFKRDVFCCRAPCFDGAPSGGSECIVHRHGM